MADRQKILRDMDERLRKLDEDLEHLRSSVDATAAASAAEGRGVCERLRSRREELKQGLERARRQP